MKKLIIASLLAFGLVTGPAMAGIDRNDFNLSGLNETQKAALIQQAEKMRAATQETVVTAEKVSEWTVLGKEVASAFISLAAELGKTVDEVLTTTIGKVALALIIYKVMGNDILGVVGGLIWLMLFVPGWIYFTRKFMIVGDVVTVYDKDTGKMVKKTVESKFKNLNKDSRVARAWTFGVLLGVGVVIELFLVFV